MVEDKYIVIYVPRFSLHITSKNRRFQVYIYNMGLKLWKDELTGNPRWGHNVIDQFNLKIFVLVRGFKSRFEVWWIIILSNI